MMSSSMAALMRYNFHTKLFTSRYIWYSSKKSLTLDRFSTVNKYQSPHRNFPCYCGIVSVCRNWSSSNGKTTDDIQLVKDEIVSLLRRKGKKVSQNMCADIEQKLGVLSKYGCIIKDVPQFLSVLGLSKAQIEKQGQRLKRQYFKFLTPDLFLEQNKDTLLRKAFSQLQQSLPGVESRTEILRIKLKCESEEEWIRLQPHLHTSKGRVMSICKVVDFLMQQNFSIDDIKKHPEILKIQFSKIEKCIGQIKKMYPIVSLHILAAVGVMDYNSFNQFLKSLEQFSFYFAACKTEQEAVVRLQTINTVLEENINTECNYTRLNIKLLLKLKSYVDYLQTFGIDLQTIAENMPCLCIAPGISELKTSVKNSLLSNKTVDVDLLCSQITRKVWISKMTPALTSKELQDVLPFLRNITLKKFILKLSSLLQKGYSLQDIEECPQILSQYFGNNKIENVLLLAQNVSLRKFKNRIDDLIQNGYSIEDVENCPELLSESLDVTFIKIKQKLGLTSLEFSDIKPFLENIESKEVIKRMNYLQLKGYSIQNIKENPAILTFSNNCIRKRIAALQKNDSNGQPSLDLLAMNRYRLRNLKKEISKYKSSLGHANSKLEALADMLEVEQHSFSVFDPILCFNLDDLKQKIQFLKSIGISNKSIVNDILCLTIALKSLERAVRILQWDGHNKINLIDIVRVATIQKPAVTVRTSVSEVFCSVLKSKIKMSQNQLNKIDLSNINHTIEVLQPNIAFLKSKGFTDAALASCPYIVGHSTDILEEYFNKLTDKLHPFEDLYTDQTKRLNLLQYLIEKDNNFTKVVNDVELLTRDEIKEQFFFPKKRNDIM